MRENGYSLSVQDKTLEGAGTFIHDDNGRGSEENRFSNFVEKHQDRLLQVRELGVTETGDKRI